MRNRAAASGVYVQEHSASREPADGIHAMIDDIELATDHRRATAPVWAAPAVAEPACGVARVAAALLVATVVAVDPGGLVPTGPLRFAAMSVITGLALVALVRRPVALPRPFMAVWAALVVVLSLATFAAVDPLHAVIGTPDRRLGLLTWLMFPAVFLVGHAISTRDATRLIMRAGAFGAMVIGGWSAAELVGHPPLGLVFADARSGGPFGQPAYLGAACLLFGPLSAALAADVTASRAWRSLGALGAAGAFVALVASQTRAAWVGATVATLAIAFHHRDRVRPYRFQVLIGAGALLAIAIVTPLGARATSTFDLSHGTSASRFDEWRVATRVVGDHPLLGVGPEGYRVVFPKVVDASYVRRYGTATFSDRAHNGVLDVTVSGGLLAGVLYAALLALALRSGWRAVRRADPLDRALGVAVIAYVVQQQFLFPLAELDPVLWLLVGILVAREIAARVTTRPRPTRPAALASVRWLAAPLAIATAAALVLGGREVLADRLLRRAADAPGASKLSDADHATRLRPDSIRAWYAAAKIAARGEAITDVDAALDRVTEGLQRSPRDPALRVLYGQLIVERAARSQLPDDIATARRVIDQLVADAPHDPRLASAQDLARNIQPIGTQ
jgi:putative inorganic carbon (HCO3(-)) transporter